MNDGWIDRLLPATLRGRIMGVMVVGVLLSQLLGSAIWTWQLRDTARNDARDAARQAAQTRGQGDASASEVYAKSYSKNAEFYSFYRSMQSYRESIGTQGDVLVIAPDSAYFKYFKQPQPQR